MEIILVRRNTAFLSGDKEEQDDINNNIQKLDMLFGNSVPFKTRKQENRVKNDVRMEHGVWRDREDSVGRLLTLR